MTDENTVRDRFDQQVWDWMREFHATAWEAFEAAMSNVTVPGECTDVVLMAVDWGNPGHVRVGIFVQPNIGERIPVDAN